MTSPTVTGLVDSRRELMREQAWYEAETKRCDEAIVTIDPPERTAWVIFKDTVYAELFRLPSLAAQHPDRVSNYFPATVTYDAAANALTHLYRGGNRSQVTALGNLNIPPIDLLDRSNWA